MRLPRRTVLAGRPTRACRDPRCANAWGGASDGIALRPNLTGDRPSRFAKRESRSDSGGWSPRPLPMLRARTLRPVDVLRPQPFPLRPRGRQVSDKALDLVDAGSLPLASQGLARGEPATLQRPPRFEQLPDGQRLRRIWGADGGGRLLDARACASRPRAGPPDGRRRTCAGGFRRGRPWASR
jgi:hypothetical protein